MAWLLGTFASGGRDGPVVLPASGAAVLGDGDGPRVWGEPRAGELRTVRRRAAWLLAWGQCLVSDSQLARDFEAALADRRWERLTRWPGCYGLMVRPGRDELILLADVAGQYPWYHAVVGGTVVVGSRAAPVAELVGGEPDAVRLVAQVAAPGLPALTAGRSAFAAVRRLDGGTAVRFGTGSGREWRYEPLLPHRGGSFETAADRLRVALTAAVRLRVATAGQVTADFSGGLDSTSLAFLAAGQAPEVQGFTYHNPLAPADDLRYARRCAPLHPALRHRVVLGSADSLNFADLHLPAAPADEPDVGVLLARTPCRLAPVAAAGSDLHLVGDGGDALLTAPYGYLADLLRRGHVRRAHRDATVLARRWRQAPAALLARAARLSTVSRRQAYTELAEAWERPAPTPRPLAAASPIGWWPAPGPEVGWFTGHARADLVELALARAGEPARAGGVADFVTGQELAANAADHRLFRDAGADRWGVPLHAPFFDHEVVRACLAVPAARRADPPAAKPLLVRALDGLVPGEVLHRATKGDYTAETYQGLRRAAAVLRTLFVEPRLADLGLIEPGPVRESLDRATLGLPMPLPSLERLVAAEVWLRARENDGVIPEPEAAHG